MESRTAISVDQPPHLRHRWSGRLTHSLSEEIEAPPNSSLDASVAVFLRCADLTMMSIGSEIRALMGMPAPSYARSHGGRCVTGR